MAWSFDGQDISLKAGADLSSYQFRFVTLDTSGYAQLCTGAADSPVGILQNDPESGHEANVRIDGTSKLHCGDTGIEIGGFIQSASDGKGTAGITGALMSARALADVDTQDDLIGVRILEAKPQ